MTVYFGKQRNRTYAAVLVLATLAMSAAVAVLVNAQSETKTFAGSATFQSGDAGGSVENNSLLSQKVINLRNAGSHPDTFRTTLPQNPDSRCGLRGSNDSYPANVLPNTLPTTLDVPLPVNGATYISAVCVTSGLAPGPFTWSYRTVSVGALEQSQDGVNPVIAEVSDTVQVTGATPCSDSDGGMDTAIRGKTTGTYAGARAGYVVIYGLEPNPTSPKPTTDPYSTYYDHCSWDPTQLNEGFCDASGRLQAMGIRCANGCKDGVCVTPPPPPVAVHSAASSSASPFSSSSFSSSVFSSSSLSSSSSSPTSSAASGSLGVQPGLTGVQSAPAAQSPSVPSAASQSGTPQIPVTAVPQAVGAPSAAGKKEEALSTVKRQPSGKSLRVKIVIAMQKISLLERSIASFERKIDQKLQLLDRVRNARAQQKVHAQIDHLQKKIDSLERQKEGKEAALGDLLELQAAEGE